MLPALRAATGVLGGRGSVLRGPVVAVVLTAVAFVPVVVRGCATDVVGAVIRCAVLAGEGELVADLFEVRPDGRGLVAPSRAVGATCCCAAASPEGLALAVFGADFIDWPEDF